MSLPGQSPDTPNEREESDELTRPPTSEGDEEEEFEEGELIQASRLVRAVEQVAEISHGPEIQGEQVTQLISNADKSDARGHVRGMTVVVGGFISLFAMLLFVLLLSWLFLAYSKGDLLAPVLSAFGGLITGLIGGFGLGSAYQRSKQDQESGT